MATRSPHRAELDTEHGTYASSQLLSISISPSQSLFLVDTSATCRRAKRSLSTNLSVKLVMVLRLVTAAAPPVADLNAGSAARTDTIPDLMAMLDRDMSSLAYFAAFAFRKVGAGTRSRSGTGDEEKDGT